jgi:MFS family permease
MPPPPRYRWFVVAVFFTFMLLHQADKLLIGPLTTPIMETFGIDEAQMGAVFTGALLVGAFLYPLWGYLYDRYSRPRLLALASAIWGSTTWLSAIAPTFPLFLASRASTGVDDSSYPGLYSLISDYFGPAMRGRVYGLLQLSQPLGYMIGLLVATLLSGLVGWRGIFFITGSLGLAVALMILLGVRDAPRSQAEPEMQGLEQIGVYRFDKRLAFGLFRKRSLLLLFAQGFVGVFPWNVITYWFFRYLETERGYSQSAILGTMAPAVLVLAAGYFVGGSLGDLAFRRTPRGRVLIAMTGVLTGAALLTLTMNVPVGNQSLFLAMLVATALFIPFASANVIATVYDITLPEVRSTALAVQYFIENGGAALAPLIAGLIARSFSLHVAILSICISAWILGAVFLALTAYLVPHDIAILRGQMRERAEFERQRAQVEPTSAL